jgi:hypothetical protein
MDQLSASFRDPSGFLFTENGILYRMINESYGENYSLLMNSGLYAELVRENLLIPHEEEASGRFTHEKSLKTIKPVKANFISYPYEWCPGQLKDAALATLEIQKAALRHGMSLKDASAYNIQFESGRPVLIDTLSFERYIQGSPWAAYGQFCRHFLAPLALMCNKDPRLGQLSRIYIDGIPLDLAARILSKKSLLNFPILTHIHIHAKSQKHFGNKPVRKPERKISRFSLLGLIDSLESCINKLRWKPLGTEWHDYYSRTNYSETARNFKRDFITNILNERNAGTLWDLGANTGVFSRIASGRGIKTVSFDIDPAAVEKNYAQAKKNNEINILPLILDLTNPSPAAGWDNTERMSFKERGPCGTAMSLALIHHLAIGNNIPFSKIALFFAEICGALIIEFVPKTDSQVIRMLSRREDIFSGYSRENFEAEFNRYFKIIKSAAVKDSERTIYFMEKKETLC